MNMKRNMAQPAAHIVATPRSLHAAAERGSPDGWLDWLLSLPVLGVGTIVSFLSVAVAMRDMARDSGAFQWSPARLLGQHVDPWLTYLSGDPQHRIILSQFPNYLHELYVLLLPFGYISFAHAKIIWALINLALAVVSCTCIVRFYELGGRKAWLFFILVFSSTPMRVSIATGEFAVLELTCLALWGLARSSGSRGVLLGIAYSKYSVPPVLGAFLAMRRRWRLLLYSLLPVGIGFVVSHAMLPTSALRLLFEPFRVATSGNVDAGIANVMAVSEPTLSHDSAYRSVHPLSTSHLPYACAILLALAIAGYLFRHGRNVDGRILLACLTASGLVCFPHAIYDFLLLAFCLAVGLAARHGIPRTLVVVGVCYFWYGQRIGHILNLELWRPFIVVSFAVLLTLIAATWKARDATYWNEHWDI
jgi:hypothetical protein